MTLQAKLLAAAAVIACLAGSGPVLAQDATEHITVYVLRGEQAPKGPDGRSHDMIMPANFVLKVGVPVDLTIINYDEGAHTITSTGMKLDIAIKAGNQQADGSVTPVTTEYTFTPTATGKFRWNCNVQCDKGGKFWAMSKGYDGMGQDGYMAGYFVVI